MNILEDTTRVISVVILEETPEDFLKNSPKEPLKMQLHQEPSNNKISNGSFVRFSEEILMFERHPSEIPEKKRAEVPEHFLGDGSRRVLAMFLLKKSLENSV